MPALICVSSVLFTIWPSTFADVPVEFFVTVPEDTPPDATVCLSGSHPALGNWSPGGVPLKRLDDGRYYIKLKLPVNAQFEYKASLGSWATVEKNKRGGEVSNRQLKVSGPQRADITVERWAALPSGDGGVRRAASRRRESTDVRLHERFPSKQLGNERTIAVYVPPGYDDRKNTDRRYPVLYMHDGQNVFDPATSFLGIEWEADDHAERLIRAGRIVPIIIVGIYNNADRMNEYTPYRDAGRATGGKGTAYGRFVVEEVKPFVDKTYRTEADRAHTAVAGSSLGGLISLYLAWTYPDTFSMCGALSPALMWNDGRILKEFRTQPARLRGVRYWVDMGTAEGRQIESFSRAIDSTRQLIDVFDAAGLSPGRDYYYQEVHQGEHNEAAWAARFDKVLLFFFSAPPKPAAAPN